MTTQKNNFEFSNKSERQELNKRFLRVENISKSFEDKELFKEANFTLAEKEKKALVGPNGCGKSTLLKIIARLENPDSGNISLGNIRIEYLPQELSIKENLNLNILDYLKETAGIREIEKKMRELEKDLADEEKLLEYGELQEQYEKLNGYQFKSIAERTLAGFGLDKYIDKKIEELSGGEMSKLAFAGILLKDPDVLLLDEPTNNLDMRSIIWLENFIKQSSASCLIVSHDRRFLDNIITGVVQINPRKKDIIEESGDYSSFMQRRQEEFERQKQEYEKNQEKISDLTEVARKKKQWARKGAKQTTGDKDKFLRGYQRDRSSKLGSNANVINKKIEKLQKKMERPIQEKVLNIDLELQEVSNRNSIQLNQLEAGYESGFSLKPVSLSIGYGEKIVFIGDNGSGKSTLLKTIAGDIGSLSGEMRLGKDLIIGNFMQNHEGMPLAETIFSYIQKNSNLSKEEIYRTLDHFRFGSDYVNKKIGELSPGERARLILAKFSAQEVNTLILDEPTNHLDIESMEALENTLEDYSGTIIIVSHDRHFLQKIKPDNFYLISDRKVKYLLDYGEYIKSMECKAKKLLKK
ncbi:MAG: ABC-F family ATP-binding cassette domain-containing protein [Bacteroidales bacterium]|nr:ABC-F family ATP-binding cassette domain-containing protein [Bacteroidales bacterium]